MDFTDSGYTIYDPLSTSCSNGKAITGCTGTLQRTAFPGDTIPASRISPIGAVVLNLYPLPKINNSGLQNNYIANVPDKYLYNQPMVRVDYDLTDSTRLYSLFALQKGTEFRDSSGFTGVAENGNINTLRQELMASQDVTHIFSPTFLVDVKASFSRFQDSFPNGNFSDLVNPTSIGLNMPSVPTTTIKQLPQFTTSDGFYPQVVGNNVSNDVYNNYILDIDFSKTWGKHSMHFGGELAEYQYANPGSVGSPNGYFNFGTQYTQANPYQRGTIPGVNDGFDVADMLLGYPDGGGVDYNRTQFDYYPTYAMYFQDDWKVTRRLTINVGVRYDIQTGTKERHNGLNRGLCTLCINPITNDPVYQANLTADSAALEAVGINPASLRTLYGGIEFAGANGQQKDAYNTDYTNLGPRFGFAYLLTPKTVIRAATESCMRLAWKVVRLQVSARPRVL